MKSLKHALKNNLGAPFGRVGGDIVIELKFHKLRCATGLFLIRTSNLSSG